MFKHKLLPLLCAAFLLGSAYGLAADTDATTATVETQKSASTEAAAATALTDPLAGHDSKLIEKYYLTKGSTYKKVSELLQSIDKNRTGLDAQKQPYYLRVDKDLTDKYFRRVRAYDEKTAAQLGDYLVAKDDSAVWRMDEGHEGLLYGSAAKMMKKSQLIIYPRYLALGSKGIVAFETPGHVPYTLKAKSLNENIAAIGENNTIIPKATGQVDILADVTVGDITESGSRRISVVTQADLKRMADQAYLTQLYLDNYWRWEPWGPFGDRGWYGPPPRRHHPPRPPRGHRPPPPPHHH